jgi:cytochrome c oxidase cbb3-type subunit 3
MAMLKRCYGVTVLLLVVVLAHLLWQPPAAGQGTPAKKKAPQKKSFLISRPVPPEDAVKRGEELYVAQCGFCHGSRATGGQGGPDLIRSVVALRDEEGELIGPIIRKGVPEKGMPPFNMTEAQIKDIAAFLRNRQQAAINRGAYEIQNILTGDAKRGEAYFHGAGKCSTCHSATGDLKGIGRRYEPVALQSRFLYPAPGRNQPVVKPPAPTMVTVTPPSGPAVSGTLQYLDDFVVGLRDASGNYRSWARENGLKVDVRDPLAGHQALLSQYTDADIHDVLAYLVTLK